MKKPPEPTDPFAEVNRNKSILEVSMQIQKIAQHYRFDWSSAKGVIAKLYEELEEIIEADTDTPEREQRIKEELGDFLFTAISLARHYSIDPALALGEANRKFECRFQRMVEIIEESGSTILDATKEQMEDAWHQAKQREKAPSKANP